MLLLLQPLQPMQDIAFAGMIADREQFEIQRRLAKRLLLTALATQVAAGIGRSASS